MTDVTVEAVAGKLHNVVATMQQLNGEEAQRIGVNDNLIDQVGMDSLAAFEFVVVIHEVMGVPLPEDVDLAAIDTIQGVATFLVETYPREAVAKLIETPTEELERLASGTREEEF